MSFEDGQISQSLAGYIDVLPKNSFTQIHLTGATPVAKGQMTVDDHAYPVSDEVWQGYRQAITRFGALPTLVEWDTDIHGMVCVDC